jgi:thiamine biosynthesis lipoprotein
MSRASTLTIPESRLRPHRRRAAVAAESTEVFDCFGSTCRVVVAGDGPAGSAADAVRRTKRTMLEWHRRFSRFIGESELSRLNRDPRPAVRVSAPMAHFVAAARESAAFTNGLVDPTLTDELERAGYDGDGAFATVPLRYGLSLAPIRRAARARADARWQQIDVDVDSAIVRRPPGVRLDSGGIAKGLFGDWLAAMLSAHGSFAVDAGGDVRFGGSAGLVRPVRVASPFDDAILHVFECRRGAAATSGIGRRSWIDQQGRPAHHLLDPSTGRPVFTGIVQVTALAPRGLEAEARAKAALLSGPGAARAWLRHGGVIVYDDGRYEVLAADRRMIVKAAG